MKRKSISVLILMVFLVVCISSGFAAAKKATVPAKNKAVMITVFIKDFKFQPDVVTIRKGQIVQWINQDRVGHTATGKEFDSGNLANGAKYKKTFARTGSFSYICTPHPWMKGTVVVK